MSSGSREAKPASTFSLGALMFWWSLLIALSAILAGGVLLIGSGLLAAIVILAVPLPLQYFLWGWWLGPRLRQLEADRLQDDQLAAPK